MIMTRQLRDGQRRRSHCKASKIGDGSTTGQGVVILGKTDREASMASIVFNTLEYAKRLDKMATKQDLRELEYRMTIRFGAMLAAAVAVLAALITFVK